MIFVDRNGIKAAVEAALIDAGTYDGATLPPVNWTEDLGDDFFERGGDMLGGYVLLSYAPGAVVGADQVTYDVGTAADDVFATKHSMLRRFRLSFSIVTDPADEQNTAHQICEHLRTRFVERERFVDAMVALGHSVLSSSDVTDVPALWDGRDVTGAAFDLTCLAERNELDASEGTDAVVGGREYYNKIDPVTKVPS